MNELDDYINENFNQLSAREKMTLIRTLSPQKTVHYKLPNLPLDESVNLSKKLRELELSHKVKQEMLAYEAKMKLLNNLKHQKLSGDSYRGIINQSHNFNYQRRGELSRVYDKFHTSRPTRRASAPRPSYSLNRTMPTLNMNNSLNNESPRRNSFWFSFSNHNETQECVEPFNIFCVQQDLLHSTDVSIKVVPPKIEKKPNSPRKSNQKKEARSKNRSPAKGGSRMSTRAGTRNPSRMKGTSRATSRLTRGSRRGNSNISEMEDMEPKPDPVKKHELLLNKAKLGGKGIIDLDKEDFMEFIIDKEIEEIIEKDPNEEKEEEDVKEDPKKRKRSPSRRNPAPKPPKAPRTPRNRRK